MSYPLRQVLYKLDASGKLMKWYVKLGQFEIRYQPCIVIKALIVADFIAEFAKAMCDLQEDLLIDNSYL